MRSDADDTQSPVQLRPPLTSRALFCTSVGAFCLTLGSGYLVGRRLGGLERNSNVNNWHNCGPLWVPALKTHPMTLLHGLHLFRPLLSIATGVPNVSLRLPLAQLQHLLFSPFHPSYLSCSGRWASLSHGEGSAVLQMSRSTYQKGTRWVILLPRHTCGRRGFSGHVSTGAVWLVAGTVRFIRCHVNACLVVRVRSRITKG